MVLSGVYFTKQQLSVSRFTLYYNMNISALDFVKLKRPIELFMCSLLKTSGFHTARISDTSIKRIILICDEIFPLMFKLMESTGFKLCSLNLKPVHVSGAHS